MAEAAHAARSMDSKYLTDPEEIIRVIKVLRDQRARVSLRFEHSAHPYTVKVLDVNGTDLLIENIEPRSGITHLRENLPFALASRVEGMYVNFTDNLVNQVASERGVPYFHVALPKRVLYQQRRKAARFRLPLSVLANGEITLFQKTELAGKILDISAGGCRAEFSCDKDPGSKLGDAESPCEIKISDLLDLKAQAAVRHHSFDRSTKRLTCGIELVHMGITERRRLEQFIQVIQRNSTKSA